MKRGQGLPLNTIVLAALAVLVLLLIVGFTTGSLSKLFKGLSSPTSEIDEKTAKALCEEYRAELKSEEAAGTLTIEKAEKSKYATKRFAIDFNRNGKIDDDEINVPCWDPRIGVLCQVIIRTSEKKDVCKPVDEKFRDICSSITSKEDCEAIEGCRWDSEYQDVYYICQPYGDRFECRRR